MKSFKSPKFNLAAAAALALLLSPAVGWSTRVTGGTVVSGEVTAAPSSSQIEVEHRSYHIRAESAAQKAALKFSVGDKVDLVLTGAQGDSSSEVVAIAAHAATQPES
jgi:hypothetical protein